MPRLLFALLLCGFCVPVVAQEPQPEKDAEPELGGSTDKATLTLNPMGHVGPIRGVFFTPDGKQLITVGKDRTVQFWDVAGGERLRVLRLPCEPTATVLSPDGKTLAVGCSARQGQRVILVNLDDGRLVWLTDGGNFDGQVTGLAFSVDGDQLAAARQGGPGWDKHGCFLWAGLKGAWEKNLANIQKGSQFTKVSGWPPGTMPAPRCVAFSPDGKRIAVGCDYSSLEYPGQKRRVEVAFLVDVPVGDTKPTPALPLPIGGHAKSVTAVTWTSNGEQVVTTYKNDGLTAVEAWSPEGKLQKQHSLGHRDGCGLHFLDAGRLLLTWYNGGADRKPRGQGQSILSLDDDLKEERKAFFPMSGPWEATRGAATVDGKVAALVSGSNQNEVLLWDLATGKPLHELPLGSQVTTPRSAGWSKDGRSLGLDAFEENKKPLFRFALDLKELQLSQNVDRSDYYFRYRAHDDKSVQLVNNPWPSLELRRSDKTMKVPGGLAFTLTPARDANWFASSSDHSLHLCDLSTGKEIFFLRPWGTHVSDLAASPDGRYLLSVNDSQVAYLYRIADDPAKTDRMPLLYLFVSQGEWILWTKEGYYAASPGGEKIMGWTVDNGPDKLPTFHPAQRFRKHFYRPDVIKLVLEKGSVAEALEAAKVQQENLDQFLPPQVSLRLLEHDGARVKVQASANARSKGQPVTELHLLIDGRPARLDDKEAVEKFATPKDQNANAEWSVTLEPGTHKLSVRAHAPDTYGLSEEATVEVKSTVPPTTKKRGTLYYLGVGVNQFKAHPELQLQGAVADVQNLGRCLEATCADRFVAVKPRLLPDDQATRAKVLEALADLQTKVKPADVVIVHFSSHGEVGADDGLYLLTHDSQRDDLKKTAISGQELRDVLGRYPSQVLLILDACHSGKFPLMRPPTDPLSRLLADDSCGVAVLTAALAHQQARDNRAGGVFTSAIVEGLKGKAAPDPFSKRVYVHNLFSYVYGEVASKTDNQQMPLYLPSGSAPPIALKE
jgi:WD40 repeat protein